MGCSPSKGNVVHPTPPNLNSKANGSLPDNSSTTINGPNNNSNSKLFITDSAKVFNGLPSHQESHGEQQNPKELENAATTAAITATTAATSATTATNAISYYDCHPLSHAVNDALQHHSNYYSLGNQPSNPVSKLPYSKITSLRTSLRGPGTDSQTEFFKMLDRKIEAGPDYEEN